MKIDYLTALQAATVVVAGWALYRKRNAKRATKAAHTVAWKRFRETSVESADRRYAFSGATCRVMKVEETGIASDVQDKNFGSYALAIFAENEAQEVFHFRFSAGKCLVKHVAPSVARAVLGAAAPAKRGDALHLSEDRKEE